MGEKIKIALLGCSHPHAPFHLRTCELADEVEAVFIWDASSEAASALAREMPLKITEPYSDLKTLLERSDFEIVLVTLPNRDCPEVALQALKAGKHVIMEKPGAVHSQAFQILIETAEKENRFLGIYYPWRCHPVCIDIRRFIEAGYLGKIVDIEARLLTSQTRFRDPDLWLFKKGIAGGGILSWLGCHWIDLFRFLLQDEVETVSALAGNYSGDPIEVEEIASVHLRFQKGTLATLHTAYVLPISKSGYKDGIKDSYIAIYGTLGNIVWQQPMSGSNKISMESVHPEFRSEPQQVLSYHVPESDAYCGAFGLELLKEFIKAARTGEVPPATGFDAMKDLQIIEAAYRSTESGKHIRLS
jgi:predicted dehydrogenase